MHRTAAIVWVVIACASSLRLSQAKTLAVLVASAMRVDRVSLANIGRSMLGTVAFAQPAALGHDSGTLVLVPLRAVGQTGSRAELSLRVISAHDAAGANVALEASVGSFTIVKARPQSGARLRL